MDQRPPPFGFLLTADIGAGFVDERFISLCSYIAVEVAEIIGSAAMKGRVPEPENVDLHCNHRPATTRPFLARQA